MRSMSALSVTLMTLMLGISNAEQYPYWTAPLPNLSLPLGGYTQLPNAVNTEIYHGVYPNSTYNHAAMIGFNPMDSILSVFWKNCQNDEDCNGQKILYSQSSDGAKTWTKPEIIFPNITTDSTDATMFVGTPITINGTMYAAASPGLFHSSYNKHTADGSQFCLWPAPIDPRNNGPPNVKEYNNTLMLREVKAGIGNLGKLFWASSTAPTMFADATKQFDIPTVNEMDAQTQSDIKLYLNKHMNNSDLYCDKNVTLKCEVCNNGCQDYKSINESIGIGNERSHYIVPNVDDTDVILYRDGSYVLYASVRSDSSSSDNWVGPEVTNIPNQNSNINCGTLPDDKIYLVSNPVTWPKNDSGSYYGDLGLDTLNFRDPVTITTSVDGYKFGNIGVVMTCTNLSSTSTCAPRWPGGGKNPGPSYPQAITILNDKNGVVNDGLYVVATNNKEDVWITHLPFDVLP